MNKKIAVSYFTLMLTIFILTVFFPNEAKWIYKKNYLVDSFCLILCEILLLRRYLFFKLDIFEPIVTISFFYIMIYFITPIYDLVSKQYLWYGYNLYEYGTKSSFIALLGYLIFYFLYYSARRKKINNIENKKIKINNEYILDSKQKVILFILVMYIICFLANVFYLIKSNGNSLVYILSLGMLGKGGTGSVLNAPIGFISMLSYSLPTCTLLYWEFGESKLLKIILFIPMLLLQVVRGFRFFVIQIAITFFAYYYLKKKKRPTIKKIFFLGILLLIPILLMTLFRNNIRDGVGVNLSIVDINLIFKGFDAMFWENLRIYKNFYGMVAVIPEKFPYVYFRQIIIGTMIMFIPRIIWPGKISMYGGEGLATIIGSDIGSGQAYPNLGEFYYAFGVWGVIFFMGLYSLWMKNLKVKYMNINSSGLDIIVFSVLLGTNLQLIIRGYTPSNFWYIIFAILPVYIVRYLISRKVLKYEK